MSIETVYALGDDALSNQWDMYLPAFPGAIDANSTALRITSLEIPAIGVGTYTIDYKTQKLTKPNGKNASPNEFTFTFRIDKYWKTYEGFENWKAIILSDDSGIMTPDVNVGSTSLIRADIDVVPVDTNNAETKKGWKFTGCWISNLAGFTLDQMGEPLTAQVTMQYIKKIPRT